MAGTKDFGNKVAMWITITTLAVHGTSMVHACMVHAYIHGSCCFVPSYICAVPSQTAPRAACFNLLYVDILKRTLGINQATLLPQRSLLTTRLSASCAECVSWTESTHTVWPLIQLFTLGMRARNSYYKTCKNSERIWVRNNGALV